MHRSGAVLAALSGSMVASDEVQSLLVALFTLGIRELLYWLRNRNKRGATALE